MKATILLLLSLTAFPLVSKAQISDKSSSFFSVWFGTRDIKFPPLENNGNLDFYDYYQMESYESVDHDYRYRYEYLGFEYFRKWQDKFATDIKLTMRSDFSINTLYLRGIYYPVKQVGISATLYSYPQLLNSFTPWYEQNFPGFTNSIDDSNWWQWQVFEHTLSAGLVFPLQITGFTITPGIHGGVALNQMFEKTLHRKEKAGNYKEKTGFTFLPSPALFVQPELTVNFNLIKFKQSYLGIQFQWRALYMTKSIDYKKVTYQWTMDSPQTTTISGNKHRYSAMEFDGGLRYSW